MIFMFLDLFDPEWLSDNNTLIIYAFFVLCCAWILINDPKNKKIQNLPYPNPPEREGIEKCIQGHSPESRYGSRKLFLITIDTPITMFQRSHPLPFVL